jgi:hypothetical protein
MRVAQVVIVPAENCNGICDIWPNCGHLGHKASDHRLVYGRITRFFVGLSLVKLLRHWRGNWSGLVHSKFRQDGPNVAVLMDVDRVKLPIAFNVDAETEGDTPEIVHPEPLLHLIIDLPNQVLVRNDKEIVSE